MVDDELLKCTDTSSNTVDTLIAIATYNERENLPRLVDSIFSCLPNCHVLIVDDNSPDGTGEWVDQLASEDQRIRCLHRAGKLGLGTATITGLRYGLNHGYRQVVTMDADFSHHPTHLVELLEAVSEDAEDSVDVSIGSRYVDGGRIEGWPWRRRWMSRWVNRYARCWLDLKVHDTSGAYRCYRTDILQKVDLDRIRARGYAVFEELLWELQKSGASFREVPITFVDRQHGQSKISLSEAFASLWHLTQLPFRR